MWECVTFLYTARARNQQLTHSNLMKIPFAEFIIRLIRSISNADTRFLFLEHRSGLILDIEADNGTLQMECKRKIKTVLICGAVSIWKFESCMGDISKSGISTIESIWMLRQTTRYCWLFYTNAQRFRLFRRSVGF